MIQYFNKSSELGPLKQIPILKQAIKIIRISYPHNAIQKINPAISKAQNLQQINLSYNKIVILDPIFELRKLKSINVSNNQIAHISKGILKLKKLQKIDLSFNLLNCINSINPIFQLFKARRGKLQFHLEGNSVMDHHQAQVQQKVNAYLLQIQKINDKIQSKQQLKQLQISKSLCKSNNNNNRSICQLNSFQHDVSSNNGSHQILGSIHQSRKKLQNIMNYFTEYERKFQVISASEFKGWNQTLLNIFRKQNQSVRSFIELTIQFINPSDATSKLQILFIRASQIQQLIKDHHFSLLEGLSQSHDTPMSYYKIWVQFYRQVRALSQKVRQQTCNIIQCQIRNQQIQALKLISPSKVNKTPTTRQDQLQGLLFSRDKQLNQQKYYQCKQCFIKNEQIRQLKQIIDSLTNQNNKFASKNQNLTSQNQKLVKQSKIINNNLQKRQQQIIDQLKQKIDVSVYQKVFLTQALGMQDLIKCDKHILLKGKTKFFNTHKFSDQFQTATALVKKGIKFENQAVSQFYSCDQQQKRLLQNGISKRPYFNKNQEVISQNKRSKKNTQNSTQKKKKSISQIGHKYDKNNSNSKSSNSKTNLISRKGTSRQVSQNSQNKQDIRKITQISQISQINKNNTQGIIISDFAITQNGKDKEQDQINVQPGSSRKALAQLIIRKTSQNKLYSDEKFCIKDRKKQNVILKPTQQKPSKLQQDNEKQNYYYVPTQYHSINLKHEQPYKDYMKYHLRNSIMQTLQRKGKRRSLSKQTFLSNKKEQKIKFFNRQSKDKSKENNASNCKISGRMSQERQIRKQTARIAQKYQSNNKSHLTILSSKLRT